MSSCQHRGHPHCSLRFHESRTDPPYLLPTVLGATVAHCPQGRSNFSAICPRRCVRTLRLPCDPVEQCSVLSADSISAATLVVRTFDPRPRASSQLSTFHAACPCRKRHAGFPILLLRQRRATSPALVCRKATPEPQFRRPQRRRPQQARDHERHCWPLSGRVASHHSRHPRHRHVEVAIASSWRLVKSRPKHPLRLWRTHQPIRQWLVFTQRHLGVCPSSECRGQGAQHFCATESGLLQQAFSTDINQSARELRREGEAGQRTIPKQQDRAIVQPYCMEHLAIAKICGGGTLNHLQYHHVLCHT